MIRTLSRLALATLAFTASLSFAATLTGSGKPVTETRAVSGFTGIGLGVPGHLELTQGDRESLTITADDNVMREIETVVENGSLKIRFTTKNLDVRRAEIRITVTARTVEHLAIGGSGNIHAGPIKASKLALSIGGSGDLTVESVAASELSVNIGGSGNVKVNGGSSDGLSASVAGSGNLAAPKLSAKRVSVNIAGSGDARVWATGSLAINVVGSGNVRYYGDPSVSRTVMGSGDIKRLGASPS